MASTSHGGYLFRLESLTAARLLTLAREALRLEEESSADCSVRLSLMHPGKLVGVSYRAPFTGQEDSGRWYLTHHSLARLLSRELSSAVHVYALDPDELEEVTSYAKGRRVGGERLEYAHIELSEDDLELEKESWPLGHLARILGVERDLLESIPRMRSVVLSLDEGVLVTSSWEVLLPPCPR
jgi:hypothetical protein